MHSDGLQRASELRQLKPSVVCMQTTSCLFRAVWSREICTVEWSARYSSVFSPPVHTLTQQDAEPKLSPDEKICISVGSKGNASYNENISSLFKALVSGTCMSHVCEEGIRVEADMSSQLLQNNTGACRAGTPTRCSSLGFDPMSVRVVSLAMLKAKPHPQVQRTSRHTHTHTQPHSHTHTIHAHSHRHIPDHIYVYKHTHTHTHTHTHHPKRKTGAEFQSHFVSPSASQNDAVSISTLLPNWVDHPKEILL